MCLAAFIGMYKKVTFLYFPYIVAEKNRKAKECWSGTYTHSVVTERNRKEKKSLKRTYRREHRGKGILGRNGRKAKDRNRKEKEYWTRTYKKVTERKINLCQEHRGRLQTGTERKRNIGQEHTHSVVTHRNTEEKEFWSGTYTHNMVTDRNTEEKEFWSGTHTHSMVTDRNTHKQHGYRQEHRGKGILARNIGTHTAWLQTGTERKRNIGQEHTGRLQKGKEILARIKQEG